MNRKAKGPAFKMKASPAKNLSNFFSSLQTGGSRDIGLKKTDMSKLRAKQARSSKGISEFQANTKKSRAESKAKRNMVDKNKDNVSDFVQPHSITDPTPEHMTSTVSSKSISKPKAYVPQEFKGKAGDKFRYRKTGATGEYTDYEFMKPGSNKWTKAESVDGSWAGRNRISDLFEERRDADELFDSPIDKKSPTKKSGFKMKKSPAKNYKKGYYGA